MAIRLYATEDTENLPITVTEGKPYYVGARAYVEQLANGAKITIIDKNGTTVATVDDGNGIQSVTLNDDYTLTIYYTDGTSVTTTSIRGETGESGVYIGEEEPTNPDVNVWVKTDGDPYDSVLKIKDDADNWVDIQTIKGETGDAAGFGTVTATADINVGTPSVTVTSSGEDTAKNFAFAFHNLGYDDSDLQSDFADLADDFDVLQGQFDTAVAAVTTDTEVTDIRVGADGITDTTAGASVRRQFTDVKSDLTALVDTNLVPSYEDGYMQMYDGNVNANASSCVSGYTPVEAGKRYIAKNVFLTYSRAIYAYGSDYAALSNIVNQQAESVTSYEFIAPAGASFVRITGHAGVAPTLRLKEDILSGIDTNANSIEQMRSVEGRLNGKWMILADDFEIGGIVFSTSGWSYAGNPKRVRSKEGITYSLKLGDVIKLSDYTNYSFILGLKKADGTYGFTGVLTADYKMPYDAEVVICIQKNDNSNVASKDAYVSKLSIESSVAVYDTVMNMYDDKYVIVDRAYLQQGYVYEQNGQVVETTTAGFYKTPMIAVKGGRNLIFNTITPVAFQYCIFFDKNQNLLGSAKSRVTSVPQSDISVNLPYNCAYIRFSLSQQNVAKVGARYDIDKPFNSLLRNKPIITFIDDDTSSVSFVTRYYNALNAAGVKGNYAVQTIELTNQEGLKDLLLEYEEKGFGMLYHCHQQIPAYSVENRNIVSAEADMVKGLREMQDAGFVNYRYWITPYGVFDAPIKAICIRHGMKCLVGSANWNYNSPLNGDKFHILRSDLHETDSSGSHTYAELQALIDSAYDSNAWIIVTTHFNEWADSTNDVRLTNIAQYALTKGFDCLTFAEAFERYELPYSMYGAY